MRSERLLERGSARRILRASRPVPPQRRRLPKSYRWPHATGARTLPRRRETPTYNPAVPPQLIPTGLLSLLVLAAGCAEESRPAPARFIEAKGTLRLEDILEDAAVDSPLAEVPAASGVAELGDVERHTLLAEDFEAFDPEAAGWSPRGIGAIAKADGGKALVVHSNLRDERRGWFFAAEPNTHYVFERRARTKTPLHADFEVSEAVTEELTRKLADPKTGWRGRTGLRLHWPEQPTPDDTWQHDSVSFFTTSRTEALAVMIRTVSERRADLFRSDFREADRAWFDDLHLARLEPNREQAIALLKSRSLADGADPALGMRKFGQFPPTPRSKKTYSPAEHNFAYRRVLYAPPPTNVAFPLELGPGAQLTFSVCLSRESRPGDEATFTVVAHASGAAHELWTHTVTADAKSWGWEDASVDLAEFAGQEIELELQTRAENGAPHPVWANPTIDTEDLAPRNVILIAVDTLRADRMGAYGYHRDTSPRLAQLAADGVRFDQVTSNATWTCPSFASILTGVVPSRHGVWASGPSMRLPQRFETLAERFRAAGWTTHAIAYKTPLYNGDYEQGFDVSLIAPRATVKADENLGLAFDWLEANAHRRNFLFLHFDDPHQPFTQPAPYDKPYGVDPADHGVRFPVNLHHRELADEDKREVMRTLYDGEIAYVDDRIGRFLDALRERGLYQDAVIGFVSDHGEELWERGRFGHRGANLFDEVTRVPLIVKPGRGDFARGRVVESQVRGFDVMPTLLDLAGIEVGTDLDAASLVPLMATEPTETGDRVAVAETADSGIALRTPDWKYMLRHRGGAVREILFDLRNDPDERTDVIAKHPDVAAKMRRQTVDYVLRHRPGRYLLVHGEGAYDVVVRNAESLIPVVGEAPAATGKRALRVRGTGQRSLHAVFQVNFSGTLTIGDEEFGSDDFRAYQPGDLDALLAEGNAGVGLFEGPPSLSQQPDASQTMDLEQLEQMRALGYIDGGDEK